MVMILVGTSGFQYRDWVPVLYPRDLDPGSWLSYYSRQFGCCELGFTCYRIPEVLTIQDIIEGTRGIMPLVFRTPSRLSEGHSDNAELARRFAAALWPLKDTGQLAGVLAQFPPKFEFIRDNFDRLCMLRDSLEGIPLIAEFGCPDWLSPRAAKHLAAAHIALACVDGGAALKEKTFFCATAELAYVRFQGRNQSMWLKGDGSAQHDYLYSRAELASVIPEIRRLEQESERVLVFMNNPWRGQAVINARMLIDDLRLTIDDCNPTLQSSIVNRKS
ncbi:MAG: DUF72 domain-containing protein [Acidobacteria bacterium]|nr:DUF72 domain-containing protein [Acidobacteriota bacterium]